MSTQNISSELNNLFAQINQVSGNSSSGSTLGKGVQSYSDIAWFASAVGELGSGDTTAEQKASTLQSLVNKALSIFGKVANNEAQAAKKEVQQETQASQKILEKSNKLGSELNGSLTEIQSNIESQTDIVKEAQKDLAKVQKSIEDKQKQIEKIVKEIEQKQQEVASAKTPKEKAEILAKIQGLAVKIADIGVSIEVDNENLQNLTDAVDDTTKDIEASTEKLSETESDGLEQLASQAQELNKVNTDVTTTSTTGKTNEVTADAAQKAAEKASSNVFSGSSIAPKLYQVANDQEMASTTRLTSIASNISKLAQGIGGLSNATQILSTFQNTIGGALSDYSSIVGEWDTAVEPVITSLGSLAAVAPGVEELNQAVESDLGTLGYEVDEQGEVRKEDETQENTKKEDGSEENNNTSAQLETPKFDVEKLRTFGI